ncbi:hypothetical protein MUK42_30096 [Musa troglodytarum]|uniref:RING-CH-type domain-containing protein n=1 Tax=Musa troglodytarum TaxID=320322 RepID=A0A9E7HH57_9LILI|nr:hypothetical protein MUK42_30096 [Musa troglodytarum]
MVTLASLLLCSPRFVRSSGRMGDHLALLVDHLLTESTLEAAIGSRKHGQIAANSASLADPAKEFTPKSHVRGRTSVGKLVECRICQEEDEDCNMEIPCSCCGSLKYAHRKCVQRWCNEKGDTVCEICLQQFKPGYTAPPKLLQYGSIPMNFRGNWEITRQDRDDSQIIALVPSERDIVHADDDDDDDDDYSALGMRNTICRQSIVIIFTVLLVLPHTLPLMIGVAEQYSFTLFSLMVLRTAGILLPIFVMVRTIRTFHQYRCRRVTHEISDPAEGENRIEPWQLVRSRPHHIQMH